MNTGSSSGLASHLSQSLSGVPFVLLSEQDLNLSAKCFRPWHTWLP